MCMKLDKERFYRVTKKKKKLQKHSKLMHNEKREE